MGANAQTSVPTFTAGDVLTAANMNISARTGVPVFADTTARDAGFGGTGEKVLAEGQLCYVENLTGVAQLQYYDGSTWNSLSAGALVRVSTTSAFSGATTVSVNDVFSSTYTNYLILLDNLAAASGTALSMRLRVSGADNTTTNYAWGGQPVNYATAGTTGESSGSTGSNTSFRLLGAIGSGNKKGSVTLWINNPQTATATTFQSIGNNDDAAFRVSGQFDQTTSFTGFSLIGGSNISGNVTVYGIEKGL